MRSHIEQRPHRVRGTQSTVALLAGLVLFSALALAKNASERQRAEELIAYLKRVPL